LLLLAHLPFQAFANKKARFPERYKEDHIKIEANKGSQHSSLTAMY